MAGVLSLVTYRLSLVVVVVVVVVAVVVVVVTLANLFSSILPCKMCVFVSRPMKIVTFPLKNGDLVVLSLTFETAAVRGNSGGRACSLLVA